MPKEAMTVVPRAVKTGFIPNSNQIAIPAKDTWASVSAIREYLLSTRKIPISGAITAIMMPASNPLTMKLY